VVRADGRDGWPANAPYDRIIATAAVDAIPTAWASQLSPDGVLVAPVGDSGMQQCTTFVHEDGRLVMRSSTPCGFMFLRDAIGGEN
jgi:protein-L-isoaspartate(D-aspartate) O-methyltransferase